MAEFWNQCLRDDEAAVAARMHLQMASPVRIRSPIAAASGRRIRRCRRYWNLHALLTAMSGIEIVASVFGGVGLRDNEELAEARGDAPSETVCPLAGPAAPQPEAG